MTVRDPEVLDLLRTEPELLALADAVRETQRPRRRRRLARVAPRLAAVGAVVAVAVLAVLFVPDRVARPSVIGRALAAIGNGRVLHLRTEAPSGLVYVDLKSGHRTIDMLQNEVWFDRDTNHFHFLMEVHGKVADIVWPDDAKSGATLEGEPDPAFTALWSGYREALESGDAKLERNDVLDGRPVYWLRFQSSQPGTAGTEVAIDRRTYKPVLFREHYPNGQQIDQRVLVAETTDFRPEDFKRKGADFFGGIGSSGTGFSLDLPTKKPVVKAPWLTAGDRVAGLPLRAANQLTARENGRILHGLVLLYGDVERTPHELTVEQLRRPDIPDFWNAIPPNAVAIQRSASTVGQGRKPVAEWTGSLLRDGIYASIETTRGEQALLEVARALRRAP